MNTSQIQLAVLRKTTERFLRLIRPKPALPIWQWAELRRRLTKAVTAKPGRYRVAFTPYQKEPQDCFTSPEVQTTVLYWAKRLGKTEMINNLHGATMEQNPRNILHVMPTLDSAKKWSKQFFMPMVRGIALLARMIGKQKSRDSSNTMLSKEFPGGTISAIGANSPSGFRQVQAPVVTCDEIDAMEATPEGDPVYLAFGRAENYSDSVQVVASTATRTIPKQPNSRLGESTGSRIHDWWLKSDQRKWFVPCGCGAYHVLQWSGVKWPEGHKHEEAYYETPCCGAKWSDYDRVKAIQAGEWRATAEFKGIAGFWLDGLNTVFPAKKGYKNKLHQMAAEFYDAYLAGEEAMTVWKNTFLCVPIEEKVIQCEPTELEKRAEDYGPENLPNKIALITGGADVQSDRIELEWRGHGLNDESWGIEIVKVYGDTLKNETWDAFANALARTFKREDGVILHPVVAGIDFHYRPDEVKKFAKRGGMPCRVMLVIGVGSVQPSIIWEKTFEDGTPYWTVSTDRAKDILFDRLTIDNPGPRAMHFPRAYGYDEAFFEQYGSERKFTRYKYGFPKGVYEKINGARNEAIDMWVYCYAATTALRPNIPVIASKLHPPNKAPEQKPPEQKPRQFSVAGPRRGGWVTGWK